MGSYQPLGHLLWLWLWLYLLAPAEVWVGCGISMANRGQERPVEVSLVAEEEEMGKSGPPSPCAYTFVLPEVTGDDGALLEPSCPSHGETLATATLDSNSLPRDEAKRGGDTPGSAVGLRIQHLELAMENYTHWIQLIEDLVRHNFIERASSRLKRRPDDMAASILDLSTSLLRQGAKHTQKLMDVKIRALDQTSRLELQLLEDSLAKNKLESRLLQQSHDISKLSNTNNALERRLREMERVQQAQLAVLREERGGLQGASERQRRLIQQLQSHLGLVAHDNHLLHSQQQQLRHTIQHLQGVCSKPEVALNSVHQADELGEFRDCADVFLAGFNKSGVYSIHSGTQYTAQVYCDMETAGGGWTVIQRRQDGTTDFHRTWNEYKMGFGSVSGEHWLGNQIVFLLTSRKPHSMRVELTDWQDQRAFSHYQYFRISSEKEKYRLSVQGYRGTAGRLSSLVMPGAAFSTRDVDNDNCVCQCATLLSGGWWFDACGPSNLNGVYYSKGHKTGKLNGIKWHYFKGPGYSLHKTTMMIRPVDFGLKN